MGSGAGTQLLLLFLNLLAFSSTGTGKRNGRCISQGGHFPPFSSEGKSPKRVSEGPKDLSLCSVFRRRTCCDVTQTHPALLRVQRLASTGEANEECLQLWELLECSICDPRVGVRRGPPLICASFCNKLFQSCSSAYFSETLKTQVLTPCGFNEVICGRVSKWASNGTEFCRLAGYSVESAEDNLEEGTEPSCFGGKASLDSLADSWKTSQSGLLDKLMNFELFNDLEQWVREMLFTDSVSSQ